MKLAGGKWSRGDIVALIGVLVAIPAIPGNVFGVLALESDPVNPRL